jgi:hypothetical protein
MPGREYADKVTLGLGPDATDLDAPGSGSLGLALRKVYPPQAIDPVVPAPQAGDAYFNTVSNAWRYFNGIVWVQVGDSPASSEVSRNSYTNSSATVPVLVDGMSIVPAAGTYLAIFVATCNANKNKTKGAVVLSIDGVDVPDTEQSHTFTSVGATSVLMTQGRVAVSGIQAIEGRWKVVSGISRPTLSATVRSLVIVKVS